jgi:hypothetical protein
MRTTVTAGLLLLAAGPAYATNYVGADWMGADLILANGDSVTGVFTNVGSFEIPVGAKVHVGRGVELEVYADNVTVDGVLDASGTGSAGGAPVPINGITGNVGKGVGFGGGGLPGPCVHGGGGGGGGYGAKGGNGSYYFAPTSAAGGVAYGNIADATSFLGSGGGSGGSGCVDPSGRGGAGGGSIYLGADTITVDGTIRARGNPGTGAKNSSGGGGGGSGGTIILDGLTVDGTGTLDARGGKGGNTPLGGGLAGGGGGGAGGRIKVFYTTLLGGFTYMVQGAPRGQDQAVEGVPGTPGSPGTIQN